MKEKKYPTKYELKEVLSSITNRSFLNSFAQKRGIFITNSSIDDLANEICNLFLEDVDLEEIRSEAYQRSSNSTLSGFVIASSNSYFDLKKTYQYIFDEKKIKPGQKLDQLVKVGGSEYYSASLEYVRKKAGRIEFLQDEISSFDFYLKEESTGVWRVEIDGHRSTDTKELKDLFKEFLKKEEEVQSIDQDFLNTDKSIEFFDLLAKQAMSEEWQFVDVKQLTLKIGDSYNDENKGQDDLDELEFEEVKEEELSGITHAILQGKNLRDNSFVKESVLNGYRFNAMTYEFHNNKSPFIIEIKAEFKGRPKVFEVSITKYLQRIGTGSMKVDAKLTKSESKNLRSDFWNKSKVIYNSLIKKK